MVLRAIHSTNYYLIPNYKPQTLSDNINFVNILLGQLETCVLFVLTSVLFEFLEDGYHEYVF